MRAGGRSGPNLPPASRLALVAVGFTFGLVMHGCADYASPLCYGLAAWAYAVSPAGRRLLAFGKDC